MHLWRCQHLITAPGPAAALLEWGEEPPRAVPGSCQWRAGDHRGLQPSELQGWIRAFLFPLKLHFWRCPEGTPWTRACSLRMHLPSWGRVDPAQPHRAWKVSSWGWLSPRLCWQGPALGRRQETGDHPTDCFLFVGYVPVPQTGAQPLPLHTKHSGVTEPAPCAPMSSDAPASCKPTSAAAHVSLVLTVGFCCSGKCFVSENCHHCRYHYYICSFFLLNNLSLMRKVW